MACNCIKEIAKERSAKFSINCTSDANTETIAVELKVTSYPRLKKKKKCKTERNRAE